jgi:hypothetical protein
VSELQSEMWNGESGLTATNVIGPPHLGPLVLCAGVRDASTDHVRLSKGLTRPKLLFRSLHNRFRGTSAVPSETRTGASSQHKPA